MTHPDERWKLIRGDLPEHPDLVTFEHDEMVREVPDTASARLRVLTLVNKLHEEAGEIAEKPHDPLEYADLIEVAYTLASLHGITPETIERERLQKKADRGGFSAGRTIISDGRPDEDELRTKRANTEAYGHRLAHLIEKARTCPPTEAELLVQRQGYARAEAGMGNDRDEAEYRAALRAGDTERVAELERAAEARKRRFDKAIAGEENT